MGQTVNRMHRIDNYRENTPQHIPWIVSLWALFGQKLCFGFDFHFPARIEECLYKDYRTRRVNVTEKLAVRLTNALPIGCIDRKDPGPNDILEVAAESFNRLEDDLVASFCLIIGIADHRLSIWAERCRPGYDDA